MDREFLPVSAYVAALLERGVRVLVYSGTYDWMCSWVSSREWLDALAWGGAAAYRAQRYWDWMLDGRKVGEVKSAGPLTFAKVFGGGHEYSVC